ncbi:pectinesterase family protein [Chryseobacterium sp. R2A-55]|uniref:pectinesterase family protein n=1 Tax=Chryseobacterium sp. R2A-55 TaxID=2744445 RepID=UPI001F40C137|nr:pectinesterase family protein [Chryseobacterium sp. R2A-55]
MKKLSFFLILMFPMYAVFGQFTDVWDFGATQLETSQYNNRLQVSTINGWYPGTITPGSSSTTNVFPSTFTAGELSWVGGTNDRLRTTNTAVTRYDENIASVSTHLGRLYCNGIPTVNGSGQPNSRYFKLSLNEDDEVKVIARGDTAGNLVFSLSANTLLQTDNFATTATSAAVTEATFVAKYSGTYFIYDNLAKASYYRIYRNPATYTTVSGTIDVSQAVGIPAGYSLIINNTAGKTWNVPVNSNAYSVNLPVGYSYSYSLANASGYLITSGETLNTTGAGSALSHHLSVSNVSLAAVTGNISGLGTNIANLGLTFTPDPESGSIYVPNPTINTSNSTYTVQLEPNIPYTISANGVNDYQILDNTVTVTGNSILNIDFALKPKYPVTISTNLNTSQLAALSLTFSNINEAGYHYAFNDLGNISLRNGTYKISANGLDQFPLELALTSYLKVNGAGGSKSLAFNPVTIWSFDDKVINSSTTAFYKGLQLNGQISTQLPQNHLLAKPGATILVPVNPNQKIIVSYYYAANFNIEGGTTYSTSSGSTSVIETVEYLYPGASAGNVSITFGGTAGYTSYLKQIKVVNNVAYSPTITVGADKQYQTINAALTAVSNMIRNANDRVTIMIDPGNYEEMLIVSQPNVTLKNASAIPDTSVLNKGVDISPNAVRITSYYGHGYNYYSMANNQKWNQDVLNVNKENGNYSYTNTGAGTTNGSYWNATVVVSAVGFEAEDIIFENSFNQYISLKESQDVVVPWTTGSPGTRPTSAGNINVQNKSLVERAAAIAYTASGDRSFLKNCKVIGRQDSFFGAQGARVAYYKGEVLGAVDFIFGGMTAVFYQTKLTMNTSDSSNDASYIVAPQQISGRGFLMYNCTVTSTTPGMDTNSTYRAKPGYFGRPWAANTSEAVFYNTTIETSNFPGSVGLSLIQPLGWLNTLGGTSPGMYEYGTTELSGVNNSGNRAAWATFLNSPILNDATAINTFNFTKGNDGWDPFSSIVLGTGNVKTDNGVWVFASENEVFIKEVKERTLVKVYGMGGNLIKSFSAYNETSFSLPTGIWVVNVENAKGLKSIKIRTN